MVLYLFALSKLNDNENHDGKDINDDNDNNDDKDDNDDNDINDDNDNNDDNSNNDDLHLIHQRRHVPHPHTQEP